MEERRSRRPAQPGEASGGFRIGSGPAGSSRIQRCCIGLLLVAACAREAEPLFDAIVVSGPREGAFFSCGCGRDRRGGMTAALGLVSGRILWVEVGDPYGREEEFVGRFLRERPAAFRAAASAEDAEEVALSDGTRLRLLFVDRMERAALRRWAGSGERLLCVAARLDPSALAILEGARGLFVVGDRPRGGGSATLRLLGMEGREGRQVAIVGPGGEVRVRDVLPPEGAPSDPLDLEYLAARHAAAGVMRRAAGEPVEPGDDDPERCGACHPATLLAWSASRHAHATGTLPGGSPESCRACHDPGGGRGGGVGAGGSNGVGCFACHGAVRDHPGSPVPAADCAGCHTETSSPGFRRERYWERIRCGG